VKEEQDELVAEAIAVPVDRAAAYGTDLPATGDDHRRAHPPKKRVIAKHSFTEIATAKSGPLM